MLKTVSALLLLALLASLAAAAPAEDPAAEGPAVAQLRALQRHLAGLDDFRAEFVQRLRAPRSDVVREESGVIYVKLPGRTRWNYLDPERKEFICDGRHIWFYEPEENAVTVYGAEAMLDSGTPLQLLLGRGDLFSDFIVTEDEGLEPLAPDNLVVRVRPREEDAPFNLARLEMAPGAPPRLVRLFVVDPLQNVTEYRFSDYRENTGLADDYFTFDPPPGTEIWEERATLNSN